MNSDFLDFISREDLDPSKIAEMLYPLAEEVLLQGLTHERMINIKVNIISAVDCAILGLRKLGAVGEINQVIREALIVEMTVLICSKLYKKDE